MRSSSGSPEAWYFLAIETTRRRFDCTNWRSASSPWRAVRRSSRLRGCGDVLAAGVERLDRLLARFDRLGQADLVVLGEQACTGRCRSGTGERGLRHRVRRDLWPRRLLVYRSAGAGVVGRCSTRSPGDVLTIPTRSRPPNPDALSRVEPSRFRCDRPASSRRSCSASRTVTTMAAVDFHHEAERRRRRFEGAPVPNPMFNEGRSRRHRSRWAAPQSPSPGGAGRGRPARPPTYIPPIDDGPVSPWQHRRSMTVRGTISATAVLFVLLLVSATVGWMSTDATADRRRAGRQFPGLAMRRRRRRLRLRHRRCASGRSWAKILGPIYALAQGFFVGAHLQGLRDAWNGIVVQAAGATLAVFAVMLAALPHADHQGHRPLPAHRHRRHARDHGALLASRS